MSSRMGLCGVVLTAALAVGCPKKASNMQAAGSLKGEVSAAGGKSGLENKVTGDDSEVEWMDKVQRMLQRFHTALEHGDLDTYKSLFVTSPELSWEEEQWWRLRAQTPIHHKYRLGRMVAGPDTIVAWVDEFRLFSDTDEGCYSPVSFKFKRGADGNYRITTIWSISRIDPAYPDIPAAVPSQPSGLERALSGSVKDDAGRTPEDVIQLWYAACAAEDRDAIIGLYKPDSRGWRINRDYLGFNGGRRNSTKGLVGDGKFTSFTIYSNAGVEATVTVDGTQLNSVGFGRPETLDPVRHQFSIVLSSGKWYITSDKLIDYKEGKPTSSR